MRRPIASLTLAALLGASLSPLVSSHAGATARVYAIPQRGIDLFVQDDGTATDAAWTAGAATTMAYVKGLGANTVSISFPFYQAGPTSSTVAGGFGTPTPARLGLIVSAARAKGLTVEIRPLLDEQSLRPSWRGTIAPTSVPGWLASYQAFVEPYLAMAAADKVSIVQISNELQSIGPASLWASFLTTARKTFKGEYQFTSNQWSTGMIAPSASTFGIDLYHGITASPSATVAQIQAGIATEMAAFKSPIALSKTTLAEVGISAQDGAYQDPSSVDFAGPPAPQQLDPQIQVNWFKAACGLVRADKMRGIFFWGLRLPGSPSLQPNIAYPARFSSQAVTEIEACFAGR